MWIHFFSTSAGFNEAVVLFSMRLFLEDEIGSGSAGEPKEGALIQEASVYVNAVRRGHLVIPH